MLHRLAAAVSAAVVLALLATGAAFAGAPASPWDANASGGSGSVALPSLLTSLLPLGTDLSSFGVASAELAPVGPQAGSDTGGVVTVDDDLADCPNADFTSIQAAVEAAPPGAKIKVCAGTYVEQVTIPAGKDGLTLYSVPDLAATIKAPLLMTSPKAIVNVSGAQNITLRHFTISGPGGSVCDSLEYGVRIGEGGSALVTDNHITHIRDTPFSGCQNGVGVLVGRNSANSYATATVVHNLIDDYQKSGVVVDGTIDDASTPDSFAEVAYNDIEGIGPTAVIAQNGIQVSRGAGANVHHNVVAHNVYSVPPFYGEGIFTYDHASSATTIHHNKVTANADGIGLYTTSNVEVGWNTSTNNIYYDGLFADFDTANNLIEHNKLTGNTAYDCEDDSTGPYNGGVANRWVQDLGNTENKLGLCKHASP